MNFWSLYLFFWFLFDFYKVFLLKKSQKGGFLPAGADVASGSWRGARDHLQVRRSTEATWQSPGGPREAQVVLTRGRRPPGRAHADAREGRHVACEGSQVEGSRV